MTRLLFTLGLLIISGVSAFSQDEAKQHSSTTERAKRPWYKPQGYANVLTANVPTLLMVDLLPGVAAGLEYERFIYSKGTFSVSLPVNAFAAKTPYKTIHQVTVSGFYAMPAFLYHPVGNTRFRDYYFGPAVAFGYLWRNETFVDKTTLNNETAFFALLLEANLTMHKSAHFVFAVHLSAGSMVGNTVVDNRIAKFGIKVGRRY